MGGRVVICVVVRLFLVLPVMLKYRGPDRVKFTWFTVISQILFATRTIVRGSIVQGLSLCYSLMTKNPRLVEAAVWLLSQRLRERGHTEDAVRDLVSRNKSQFEDMDEATLAERYLTELNVIEMSGPH